MKRCPLCGGEVHYVGFSRVECVTEGCTNYAARVASERSEAEREPDGEAADYELWAQAFAFF
ncbi:MAG TPA: hypothetical protein RMH85_06290 [Polyangiaceae bacterium LLY-WYZ-15_(1-7)]|mgnify:CR=1 FL=1|nr:hypothetical protein [Myxococcales bacterium]MAT26932.1 hypothetical protein [Sandaracinus sp.]HJK92430.1 hypothetical protein [Polyangiaceae bacterium LLY-WYZ-15_(1-7)]MBJ70185.1 hypothetical protein [Sandaracinus sp.]HJL03135.1 hypothetical protein [Polyangiaceae bacterium LLY-WYZ-15_(1-7)]